MRQQLFRIQYSAVQDDAPFEAKKLERQILQQSIDMLRRSIDQGAPVTSTVEAVYFTSKVWTTFLEDLAAPGNQLTNEVRANLISIGIWILKQLDAVRAGETSRCKDIIEITEIIRDGLDYS